MKARERDARALQFQSVLAIALGILNLPALFSLLRARSSTARQPAALSWFVVASALLVVLVVIVLAWRWRQELAREVTARQTLASHALGLQVVAEGVETAAQRARVRELSCDFGQGFYLARPLEGEALRQIR